MNYEMFVNWYSECFPEILQLLRQHKFFPIITFEVIISLTRVQSHAHVQAHTQVSLRVQFIAYAKS